METIQSPKIGKFFSTLFEDYSSPNFWTILEGLSDQKIAWVVYSNEEEIEKIGDAFDNNVAIFEAAIDCGIELQKRPGSKCFFTSLEIEDSNMAIFVIGESEDQLLTFLNDFGKIIEVMTK